jgi:sec-independent protein translocase protein TatA
MPNLGPVELIIILVIAVMIFGVGRLPEIGGAVGKTIKEFRKNMGGREKEEEEVTLEEEGDVEEATEEKLA